MSLQDQISEKLTESMKSGDSFSLGVLRMVKTALQNAAINKDDHTLSDAEQMQVMQKEVKKRRDAAVMYSQGNRPELAKKEEKEAALLEQYLPSQMSDEQIEAELKKIVAEVGAASAADTGKVMGQFMAKFRGQADGGRVTQALRDLLS